MKQETYEQARHTLGLFYSDASTPADVTERYMKSLPLYERHRIAIGLLRHIVAHEGIAEIPKDLHTCFACCIDSLNFLVANKTVPECELASLSECVAVGKDMLGKVKII
jgi:hypothetical protein